MLAVFKVFPRVTCCFPQYAKIVQKLGFPATFKDFKIQNMVGSCDVKFPIRLEGLAYQQTLFSSVSHGRHFAGMRLARLSSELVRQAAFVVMSI